MADICEVTDKDIVIDPACGTGGFLVACLQRIFGSSKLRLERWVEEQLSKWQKITEAAVAAYSL